MTGKWVFASAIWLALGGSVALGQNYSLPGPSMWEGPGYGARNWGYSSGGYGVYGGYGTYESGVLHGLGAYARGVGEYNYYSAMAVRELEDARYQAIKNHKLDVENWVSLRKAHQERKAADWEREKLTAEELVHVTKASRPDRLTAAQYEPATGKLTWPAQLLGEEFAKDRAALDAAFAKRTAEDAGADSAFHDQVRRLSERMLERLRTKMPELSSAQFMASKKFLVGLKYESLSPMDIKALATSE